MANLLFVTWDGGGNVPPAVGIAAELEARARRPYVILEHLYDGYIRGPWLRGPMGLAMRLKRLRPTAAFAGAESCLVASLAELDAKATSGVLHTARTASSRPVGDGECDRASHGRAPDHGRQPDGAGANLRRPGQDAAD